MSQLTPAPTWTPAPTAPRPQLKKPFYKRWWFIAIISTAVIAAIERALEGGKTSSSKSASQSQNTFQSQNAPEAKAAPQVQSASEAIAPVATPTPEAEPKVPREYKNTLGPTKSYSNIMHMPKKGIYSQLTSPYADKFSAEATQYVVGSLQADYNTNALAKAKEYQKAMHMSSQAIRDQLASGHDEKLTTNEADYVITHLND